MPVDESQDERDEPQDGRDEPQDGRDEPQDGRDVAETPSNELESFPEAEVRAKTPTLQQLIAVGRNYWWAVGGAILVVLFLLISVAGNRGSRITVDFAEGHGIKPGDAMRHLGIEVGIVEVVQLKQDGSGIRLEVRLADEGEHLAREGTRFWIARPEVSLSRVQGLDTVVGAKYVAVLPGPHDSAKQEKFQGSETPIWLDDAGEAELVVEFQNGQGLRVGDPLRYRGIEIGEVMNVVLEDSLQTVRVHIQLNHAGSAVARAGSQFWIQHPDVSFSGIRGLDTVIGGRYVAVIPAPSAAAEHRHFVGLEEPPAAFDRPGDGLEIRITSSHRSALRQGVSVTYRGLPIGRILSTGLAADAVSVEARVYIQPEFKHLVRRGSVFWNAGGVRFKAGVGGVDFRIDSLESVVKGSVAMATPEEFGDAVTTGDSFEFHDEAEEEWLSWSPRIPFGAGMASNALRRLYPTRYRLTWESRTLGFRKSRGVSAWGIRLAGDRLLTLGSVLDEAEEHLGKSSLELQGHEYPLADRTIKRWGNWASLADVGNKDSQDSTPIWSNKDLRSPKKIEDCLIITSPTSRTIPIAVGRLTEKDGIWVIDPSLSFDATDWQAAAVVATSDQKLIGILRVEDQTGEIVPYAAE